MLQAPSAPVPEAAPKAGKGVSSAIKAETLRSPEEMQWLNKLDWNLREGLKSSADVFTIGYEGRSLATVVEAIKRFRIKKVVDIRADPSCASRPEFDKPNLSRTLQGIGVAYVHHPELGMPLDKQTLAAKGGSRPDIWKWYRKEIIPILGRLLRAKLSLPRGEVAFLCEERDPTTCHRHCIAEQLGVMGHRAYDI